MTSYGASASRHNVEGVGGSPDYLQGYRAGCTRIVVKACFTSRCGEVDRLKDELTVVEVPPGLLEAPLRLDPILDHLEALGLRFSPDEVLVVTDVPVLDERDVRVYRGFVKLLDARTCSGESLVKAILASACRPVFSGCVVDFGLGWWQA